MDSVIGHRRIDALHKRDATYKSFCYNETGNLCVIFLLDFEGRLGRFIDVCFYRTDSDLTDASSTMLQPVKQTLLNFIGVYDVQLR